MRKATGGGYIYGHDTNLKVGGILLQSPRSMLGDTHRNIEKKRKRIKHKMKKKVLKQKREKGSTEFSFICGT